MPHTPDPDAQTLSRDIRVLHGELHEARKSLLFALIWFTVVFGLQVAASAVLWYYRPTPAPAAEVGE